MPCYPKRKLSVTNLFPRHILRDSGVLSARSVDTHSTQWWKVKAGLFHGPVTWGLVLRRVHFGVQCSMVATWDCVMILLRTCGLSVAKRTTDYASGPITSARGCPASFCLSMISWLPPRPSQSPLPSAVQWLLLPSALAGAWVLVQGSLGSGVHALHTTEHRAGGRRI